MTFSSSSHSIAFCLSPEPFYAVFTLSSYKKSLVAVCLISHVTAPVISRQLLSQSSPCVIYSVLSTTGESFFLRALQFSPANYYSTNAPYSSTRIISGSFSMQFEGIHFYPTSKTSPCLFGNKINVGIIILFRCYVFKGFKTCSLCSSNDSIKFIQFWLFPANSLHLARH